MAEKTITIFGTGRAKPGGTAYTLAYSTGKLLAHAGFTIANGGYGGTMLAAVKLLALPALPSRAAKRTNISAVKLLPIHSTKGLIR